ncbi:hypothetical protein SAMN05216249_10974 [Acetitomaculum ruminis DSM 5522]|uniref:DUF6472 domain-containing protein n=1 Tax=Acetitomaculum ruminis DSM 5522 TaxID=1120918 RepID=A0A1I0YAP3_9FIRM|nr:DUF6472 family protein [Acetitomaculum ruminis]SFB10409.1 hypothetical protein SAMN05216249_10974 [Acetitomaculum ruminis DSM 5522]
MKKTSNCESCIYYVYDEEYESYSCEINLDEDEMYRFLSGTNSNCSYYRNNDDYRIARKQ